MPTAEPLPEPLTEPRPEPLVDDLLPAQRVHLLISPERAAAVAWVSWFVAALSTGRLWDRTVHQPAFIGWIAHTASAVAPGIPTYRASTSAVADVQSHLRQLWAGTTVGKGTEDFPLLDAALEHFARGRGGRAARAPGARQSVPSPRPPSSPRAPTLLVLDSLDLLGIEARARAGRIFGGLAVLDRWCNDHGVTLLALHPTAKQPHDHTQRYTHICDLAYGDVHLIHGTCTKFVLLDPKMAGRDDALYSLHVATPTYHQHPVRFFRTNPGGEFQQVLPPEPDDALLTPREGQAAGLLLAWTRMQEEGATIIEIREYLLESGVPACSRPTIQRLIGKLRSQGRVEKKDGRYWTVPQVRTPPREMD